jgi:hypothetical protein
MNNPVCPKCGAEIVFYTVGFPHARVFIENVCLNCIKLKLGTQIKSIKI